MVILLPKPCVYSQIHKMLVRTEAAAVNTHTQINPMSSTSLEIIPLVIHICYSDQAAMGHKSRCHRNCVTASHFRFPDDYTALTTSAREGGCAVGGLAAHVYRLMVCVEYYGGPENIILIFWPPKWTSRQREGLHTFIYLFFLTQPRWTCSKLAG